MFVAFLLAGMSWPFVRLAVNLREAEKERGSSEFSKRIVAGLPLLGERAGVRADFPLIAALADIFFHRKQEGSFVIFQ